MNPRSAWTLYIVLRLAFFIVPFAALMLLGWPWWLSMILATLIALSLSVIFLSRPRGEASMSIYEWRNRDRTADDIVEDEAVDAVSVEPTSAGPTSSVEPTSAGSKEFAAGDPGGEITGTESKGSSKHNAINVNNTNSANSTNSDNSDSGENPQAQ